MSSTLIWILSYVVNLLFWLWVVFWGGAERLEGTFASGFIINSLAPNWTSEGIKLFGWLTLAGSTIGFVLGVCCPSLRT